MTPERWHQVKDIVAHAAQLEGPLRDRYVQSQCGSDEGLRREVESMLQQTADCKSHVGLSTLESYASSSVSDSEKTTEAASFVGRRIGAYEITAFLGEGGMGRVFLAQDTALHRKVAIKFVNPSLFDRSFSKEQLIREARAVAQLNHPNITHVYHVHEHADETFIVMEYLPGETLAQHLSREGPLTVGKVTMFGTQIARAVADAHDHNILHCDLKPANVFITTNDVIKVMDFGIARVLSPLQGRALPPVGASPSLVARRPGTPGYMSPEQKRGELLNERSDIYSLGVMLHELATGTLPSTTGIGRHSTTAVRLDRSVPRALRPVLSRALAPNPDDRYAKASELVASLEAVTQTASLWWSLPPRTFVRAALFAVALATLVAGAVLWLVLPNRTHTNSTRATALVILPITVAGDDEQSQAVAAGLTPVLFAALQHLGGLTVVPSVEVAAAAARNNDAYAVGRTLGAGWVVTATVGRTTDQSTVTISILNVSRLNTNWTRTFHASPDRLFDLHRKISYAVVTHMREAGIVPRSDTAGPLVAMTRNDEAFAEYAQGQKFIDRRDVSGNIDHAIRLFTSAIRRDPQFALAHAALGRASWLKYQSTKELSLVDSSRTALLEALRIAPENSEVRFALAELYEGTGRRSEAREEIRRVLDTQPNHDSAHRLLARMYAADGDVESAVDELTKAIDIRPEFWGHHAALGRVYYDNYQYDRAVAAFTRVTELQPDSAFGYQMRGAAYHTAGALGEAERDYTKALTLAPSAAATLNLAAIYEEQGQLSRALQTYERAIAMNPKIPAAHVNLGDVRAQLGQHHAARSSYQDAVVILTEVVAINPEDASSISMLAVCRAKLGRAIEARRLSQLAVSKRPRDRDIRFQAAEIEAIVGDAGAALSHLKTALELGYRADLACKDPDLRHIRGSSQSRSVLSCTS